MTSETSDIGPMNPFRRLAKDLYEEKPDPLYDLIKGLVETQLTAKQRIMNEEDVGLMMQRRSIPKSFWAHKDGYGLALIKCWRLSEVWAWIIVGRAGGGPAKKFLMSELDSIERAVKDTLKANIETFVDENETILHLKGCLN